MRFSQFMSRRGFCLMFLLMIFSIHLGNANVSFGDGTVTVLRPIEARTMDIHKNLARSCAEVLFMLTDTLVFIEDDMKTIHPGLAKSWKVSPNGLTYTFQLREDVTFCNGKPMTADDVEYSFKRWLAPETRSPSVLNIGKVEKVQAKGKFIFEITLKESFSELLTQLAQPYAGVIDKDTVTKLGEDFGLKGFMGTGPFCWESWTPRDKLVLKRHEGYKWGPPFYSNKGPAHVDKLIWKVIPEDSSRVGSLLVGQGDICYVLPWNSIKQLRENPNIAIVEPRSFGWMAFVGLKIHREPLNDPLVRRAMLLAVDQETLVSTLWFGEAIPAHFIVIPGTVDYDKTVESKFVHYNPLEANRLLDQAGWKKGSDGFRYKGGKKLTATLLGQEIPFWRERFEAVQGYMRVIGFDFQLRLWEPSVGMSKMLTEDYDMWSLYASYCSAGDLLNKYFLVDQRMSAYRGKPEEGKPIEELVLAGRRALTVDERFQKYSKAQHLIYEGTYWIPMANEKMLVTYNKKRVTGVKPHSMSAAGLYKGLDIKLLK